MDKMSGNNTAYASELENFNHQEVLNDVEKLNSQFEEMKDALTCLNVRAQKLEADMALMFDPFLAETLQQLQLNCDRCSATINGNNN
ncbi:hypothetical protein ACF0H5_013027 [Mactra antiquata]